MPRDRMLTESDGAFAQVEGRPLFPWDVAKTEPRLAWPLESVTREVGSPNRLLDDPMSLAADAGIAHAVPDSLQVSLASELLR
jgi:hypothetical protein